MTSPYEIARKEGYSDDEIFSYLGNDPKYSNKIREAKQEGYSDEEIGSFLTSYKPKEEKPKKSKLEKAGRIAGQFAIGAAENALLPYEIGVAPLASKDAQNAAYRETLSDDLEMLMDKKAFGEWTPQDQEMYDHITKQILDPRESEKYAQTLDIGVRGLAEKATGVDLHPEGTLEKAASWIGFLKDPKKLAQVAKHGISGKELIKSIAPGTKTLRGLGAGTALQLAEDGDFGPTGTMAAAVAGDLIGGGIGGGLRATKNLITKPKETIAKGFAKMTPKEGLELQKSIIEDFREAHIQPDLGTITNSDMVKMMQARLSQSGLTGKALTEFRETLTNEIKEQYHALAEQIGESRFQTLNEASEIGKEQLTLIRDAEKNRISGMYEKARKRVDPNVMLHEATVSPAQLANSIKRLENSLSPGAVKSTEQSAVLKILDTLKQDIYNAEGKMKPASINNLINDKIALNDIINYEVQGGQKQLLKTLVRDLDETIIEYGKQDKEFLKNYVSANKQFGEHARTFRNENINKILSSRDPEVLMNKMNSVQGMKDLEKAFSYTPEGKELFGNLKRMKLDNMIGKKMTDNVTHQLKHGTFANLLKNPKDFELAKEILGQKNFSKLLKLQKASGKLAETAQKFLNASQSGTAVIDVALVGNALKDLGYVLSGNPWPFIKTAAGFGAAKYVANLMGNGEFLTLVEEAILASSKNDMSQLMKIGAQLEEAIRSSGVQVHNNQ